MRRWHATRFIVAGRNRIHHRRFHDPARPRSVADVLRLDQPQQLTVNAWIRTIRKQRKFAFVELDDGSSWTSLQAVLDASQAQHLSTGAAVKVTGHLVPSPTDKEQEWELRVADIQAVGQSDAAENPIQKKYQSPEFLRSLPHLRTRTPHNALLLRLRSEAIAAATAFFGDKGFVQAHPPVITSSDCEGAGEVFTLTPRAPADGASPFFREQKYLTVSSQLHLEALAQSVGRVWALAPAFRAEQSDTPRHLSEFYMLEAEMAFTDDLADIMKVVEDLIRAIAQRVRCSSAGNEMLAHNARHDNRASTQELRKRLDGLLGKPWPRFTYKEAITMLHDAIGRGDVHFQVAPAAQDGLQTEHEKYIADTVGRGSPVFVTDYPQSMKPFYMAASKTQEVSELGTTAACFDLLLPEVCEVVGGSLREHSLDAIQRAMRDKGLGEAAGLEWYIDLRRYGSVPHGGFGLGFDRLLCYLAGVSNIRDVVAFPRWYGRCLC